MGLGFDLIAIDRAHIIEDEKTVTVETSLFI